ncbi:hypothetical protein AGOR_G00214900 [Albula goreensis]|uniref:Uncharacterized protein n=1 Tax=Albula goreensis TaxID=1534307 RepID=A0A8T3CNW7_9TELE|nr:hypothetical protein AGOR_G00214900 [Albula goreensis]
MAEGDLCEEDVDQPHDEEGCTPLITACQKGLTQVVHFLLEKGADVTLCNHDDQTAVHLSGSVLQGELLAAATRCLSPQAQLLCAAWRGDLHSLQNLLKEPLDVNTQNRDGLTPLMLAVRDVDLFEGLGTLMVWEYRPVEVVRELLHHQAALSVCDHRGRCALHYAAQTPPQIHLSHPSPRVSLCSLQPKQRILLSHQNAHLSLRTEKPGMGYTRQTGFETDQRISLSFHTAAETLKAMRQEYQELEDRNSQGVSLPSLWDRGRRGDRLCSLDTGQGQVKMTGRSCQPMTPRAGGRGDSLNPNLTAPHPPQLSQSAPLLGEPLLDSGSMLRVRAHIQTRLGGSELDTEINGRRRSLPILCPRPVRTPRHLAPLDRGQREGTLLLGNRHPLPLKPITLLPLASMSKVKRERLSRRGSRGPRRAKGGSEESSSSSVSSQGSLDLEEEQQEEEDAEEEEEEEEDTESPGPRQTSHRKYREAVCFITL